MLMQLTPRSWFFIIAGLVLCGYIKMTTAKHSTWAQKRDFGFARGQITQLY